MPATAGVSRRAVLRLITAVGVRGELASVMPAQDRKTSACDHIAWVAACLQRMQSIEPGMSRAQLLRFFTTEGGISTGLQRTFVSRDCPYFKVNVTFRRATATSSDPQDSLSELDNDLIKTISAPYLQFSIMD